MNNEDKLPFRAEQQYPLTNSRLLRTTNYMVVRHSGEFGFGVAATERLQTTHEGLVRARELFRELETDYGVETAGFKPLITEHNDMHGRIGASIVSSYIHGREVDAASDLDNETRQAAGILLEKLTKYFIDKQKAREPYLVDIFKLNQYKFRDGTFVLIDMDPYFESDGEMQGHVYDDLNSMAAKILDESDYSVWNQQLKTQLLKTAH